MAEATTDGWSSGRLVELLGCYVEWVWLVEEAQVELLSGAIYTFL